MTLVVIFGMQLIGCCGSTLILALNRTAILGFRSLRGFSLVLPLLPAFALELRLLSQLVFPLSLFERLSRFGHQFTSRSTDLRLSLASRQSWSTRRLELHRAFPLRLQCSFVR